MEMRITSDILEEILADARATPVFERCGLLLGHAPHFAAFLPCTNISLHPRTAFEIDPAQLIAAHIAARNGGPQILGHYHFHPDGVAMPSVRDADHASAIGQYWMIVTGDDYSVWRADKNGAIHGRFNRATLAVSL